MHSHKNLIIHCYPLLSHYVCIAKFCACRWYVDLEQWQKIIIFFRKKKFVNFECFRWIDEKEKKLFEQSHENLLYVISVWWFHLSLQGLNLCILNTFKSPEISNCINFAKIQFKVIFQAPSNKSQNSMSSSIKSITIIQKNLLSQIT